MEKRGSGIGATESPLTFRKAFHKRVLLLARKSVGKERKKLKGGKRKLGTGTTARRSGRDISNIQSVVREVQ